MAAPISGPALQALARMAGGERWWEGIVAIVEPARAAGRHMEHRQALETALEILRPLGMRVGRAGQAGKDAGSYDALLVDPGTAGAVTDHHEGILIATGITTVEDLAWAEAAEADLLEGAAVAEPLRVAPLDLSRLQR